MVCLYFFVPFLPSLLHNFNHRLLLRTGRPSTLPPFFALFCVAGRGITGRCRRVVCFRLRLCSCYKIRVVILFEFIKIEAIEVGRVTDEQRRFNVRTTAYHAVDGVEQLLRDPKLLLIVVLTVEYLSFW